MSPQDDLDSLFPREVDIPGDFRLERPIEQDEYLINGELLRWHGPMEEVISPVRLQTTEGLAPKLAGRYPLLTETEALAALEAAHLAYDNGRGRWPVLSVGERINHVQDFLLGMQEKKREVVRLLMWEVGKSLGDSEKEFDRTVVYIRATIDALKDLDRLSSRFVIEQGIIGQIRRAPLGVVLCMGPFNYPLNETLTTLIPALIMGNSVIVKPPKHGLLLYGPLLDVFRKAFPAGVVNVLFGRGPDVITPIMSSPKVNVLAFIGTSQVADRLKKLHPQPHRLRCVLGLEAKNVAIVLADADLETTIRECVSGTLSFNGQRCTALKMIFVEKKIAESFLAGFSEAVSKLKCGMPWEEAFITPLPEEGKPAFLQDLVRDAEEQGAQVVNPGGGTNQQSFFYPAIVYPVGERMRLYHEEQFGPVIPVTPFEDIEMPIQYVVNSNYGQQLSIFGKDPDVIARLVDPLVNQVCRVNLNSQCQRGPDTFPFTGRKDSAEGTLSVSDALRVFSIRTLVAAKETELNRKIITKIVRERKSNFLNTDFIL